jgi:hypothetical protein
MGRNRRGKQHTRGDVRPVRETDGDDLGRIEPILCRRSSHKRDQVLRPLTQIIEVEYTLRVPLEEARSAVLGHGAARAQEPRIRRQHLAQLNEVVFVAARSVQEEQRALVVALRRQIAMGVRRKRVGHGWAPACSALVFTHLNVVET